ncbi:unnamed protein product [Didymodactylos carnosus]|uniref:Uncharacterized protein n=1 Tax=Didymodactylos carnosus TaxID=1234261 RepID=A0A813ZBQ7_9BILA|nr:unnamed protein product [Didymodactylos carnosus]CAF1101742.1 unnamed protein product [Didymodactylos carnosus]CAF3680797.1 unnamed protein product [Didymodactylos carnosus]CAF3863107.1 unnamed protein product [Didymodactylos carnosus]
MTLCWRRIKQRQLDNKTKSRMIDSQYQEKLRSWAAKQLKTSNDTTKSYQPLISDYNPKRPRILCADTVFCNSTLRSAFDENTSDINEEYDHIIKSRIVSDHHLNNEHATKQNLLSKPSSIETAVQMIKPIVDIIFTAFEQQLKSTNSNQWIDKLTEQTSINGENAKLLLPSTASSIAISKSNSTRYKTEQNKIINVSGSYAVSNINNSYPSMERLPHYSSGAPIEISETKINSRTSKFQMVEDANRQIIIPEIPTNFFIVDTRFPVPYYPSVPRLYNNYNYIVPSYFHRSAVLPYMQFPQQHQTYNMNIKSMANGNRFTEREHLTPILMHIVTFNIYFNQQTSRKIKEKQKNIKLAVKRQNLSEHSLRKIQSYISLEQKSQSLTNLRTINELQTTPFDHSISKEQSKLKNPCKFKRFLPSERYENFCQKPQTKLLATLAAVVLCAIYFL